MNIVKESLVIEETVNFKNDYLLILWNDEVNNMIFIALSLCEILDMDYDSAYEIMYNAHNKGNAIAYLGNLDDVIEKHNRFSESGIMTTIENI